MGPLLPEASVSSSEKMGPGLWQSGLLRGTSEITCIMSFRGCEGLHKRCCFLHFVLSFKKTHTDAGQRAEWASGSLGEALRGGVGDSSSFPPAWARPGLPPPSAQSQFLGNGMDAGMVRRGERAINREGRKQK